MRDTWQILLEETSCRPACGGPGSTRVTPGWGRGACTTQRRWEEQILREDSEFSFHRRGWRYFSEKGLHSNHQVDQEKEQYCPRPPPQMRTRASSSLPFPVPRESGPQRPAPKECQLNESCMSLTALIFTHTTPTMPSECGEKLSSHFCIK